MVLQITMSEEEKALLQKQADAAEKSLDEFARERLLNGLSRSTLRPIPTSGGNGLNPDLPDDFLDNLRDYIYDDEFNEKLDRGESVK
ncbi:MAG: hypothetical protein AAF743_00480 [Planctomycetota bacterium]